MKKKVTETMNNTLNPYCNAFLGIAEHGVVLECESHGVSDGKCVAILKHDGIRVGHVHR